MHKVITVIRFVAKKIHTSLDSQKISHIRKEILQINLIYCAMHLLELDFLFFERRIGFSRKTKHGSPPPPGHHCRRSSSRALPLCVSHQSPCRAVWQSDQGGRRRWRGTSCSTPAPRSPRSGSAPGSPTPASSAPPSTPPSRYALAFAPVRPLFSPRPRA